MMADALQTSTVIDGGEALLRRVQRLVLRADRAANASSLEVVVLLDEFEAARRRLLAQSLVLETEMRKTAARVTAVAAYARGARGGLS